jgi:3-methyladenine DNA glycosylase AlkD
MKLPEILEQLDANALGKKRFPMGPLRALGKKLKTNHDMALSLWATGRTDAMMLATMVMAPEKLSAREVEGMLAPLTDYLLVDELTSAVADGPCAEDLGSKWIDAPKELTGRAGWNLLAAKIIRNQVATAECAGILKTIEARMKKVPVKTAESMMRCLVEIGVRFPEHRERALDIGKRWGVIDENRPVSKGCTPFYAPAWIEAMLTRKN